MLGDFAMNVVDYIILGIIGICFLYGLYRGFVSSILGLICMFLAMFAAYAVGPTVAAEICKNDTVVHTLSHYTDAASSIGDLDLALRTVSTLDTNAIANVVARADLPPPFDALLKNNLLAQVFAPIGSTTVSEYINQTVVTSIISILCYILTFAVAYFALTMFVNMLNYMFRFPSLKYLDMILGGAFGVARGIFFVYILFALVPIAINILPIDGIGPYIEASQLGSIVYKSSIVTTILQGHI
jgi:uncharacterized membrane protein required for colicin V production